MKEDDILMEWYRFRNEQIRLRELKYKREEKQIRIAIVLWIILFMLLAYQQGG